MDNRRDKGLYVLTGSNNFLLNQSISQSLAGRVGYLNLPPSCLSELPENAQDQAEDHLLLKGFYPPVYDQGIPYTEWYPNYLKTYVERDVRQIKNITDLLVFERFMALLAGRCGQELNMSALANETGVDTKTIQSWLGILESCFLIYLLRPFHRNFQKTVVKRPKLYFGDPGLVCSLLRIRTPDQLAFHPLRGALFENMVVMELMKMNQNKGEPLAFYYWRDKSGREIDLIIEKDGEWIPVEIKSSQTFNPSFYKHLNGWKKLSGSTKGYVLYAGAQQQQRSDGNRALPWELFLTAHFPAFFP